jgi:peroxiredoxin
MTTMNRFLLICAALFCVSLMTEMTIADEGAVVRGKVVFDENRLRSWNGLELQVPLKEIPTRLRKNVELPPIPFPSNWPAMKAEARQAWLQEFQESDEGKDLIEQRQTIFQNAPTFDVKIEPDGDFVVYDVPPGIYGLQGRFDQEIGGGKFSFEVFGQIEVLEEVEEVVLDPIQVAVTPLLAAGETAPPIEVEILKSEKKLTLNKFKGKPVVLYFWISTSPSTEFLENVQRMHAELEVKHGLKLLNICVDDDRDAAAKRIIEKKLSGNHGFTAGFYHRSLFDYGVRAIPSIFLIGPDGKIMMTQYDFANAFRLGQSDLSKIVADRITGKSLPTLATPENGDATPEDSTAK